MLENPFVLSRPHPRQVELLLSPEIEVLYGGAAGGGKSEALLVAALQYVGVPHYSALILRRTYTDLALPGAIMDRAVGWFRQMSGVKWDEKAKIATFPTGATVTFGYLDRAGDHYRYQSSEFQTICFDELTQFTEDQYRYLFSRLRRCRDLALPLRMRSATNPGGAGHGWVKRRFIDEQIPGVRHYIPATVSDNPSLDQEQYMASLAHLDPTTRAQLLNGDWTARRAGSCFKREWFEMVDQLPPGDYTRPVRYWDLAATEYHGMGDPDWTVGVKMVRDFAGRYWVLDVRRVRQKSSDVEELVRRVAQADGRSCRVRMSKDPGAAGGAVVDYYRRHIIPGYDFDSVSETGSKFVRAQALAGQAGNGNVKLLKGPWATDFLDELEAFSEDEKTYAHDDQVDSVAGAFLILAESDLHCRPLKILKDHGRRTEPVWSMAKSVTSPHYSPRSLDIPSWLLENQHEYRKALRFGQDATWEKWKPYGS